MSESFSIPTPGDFIAGKYRVIEELGRGAYGVVFRAEQAELGRSVALKTLLPQAFLQTDIVERFHREAQLISLLDHGNIIKLYDYGVDEGLLYMAVEFVDGRTLSDLIKTEAPLPPEQARDILSQLMSALEYAHSKGVIHRDLKPENVVLLKSRPLEGIEGEVVKVLDFGIAKLQQDEHGTGALKTLTQDGTVLGTPHYMSPENIVGDPIDRRADIYALGVILFEMLTGEHPFEAPSPSAVMVRHLRDDAPHIPGELGGSTLDAAVQACLEKQPDDRVGSIAELRKLLESNKTVVVRTPEEKEAAAHKPQTSKGMSMMYGVIGALAVLLVFMLAWRYLGPKPEVDPSNDPTTQGEPVPDAGRLEPDVGTDIGVAVVEPDVGNDASSDSGEDNEDVEFTFDDPPPKNPRPKRPPKPNPEVKPEVAKMVSVRVRSTPSNASVTIDGTPVGNTPLTRKLNKTDKTIKIRVSLLGYKNHTFRVVADKDIEVDAKLEYERIKMLD